jgi:DNA-binding response OmpR family regulator
VAINGTAIVTTLALTGASAPPWSLATAQPVTAVTDPQQFRRLLRGTGPAVVVVFAPPATIEEIDAVAAARRVRRDLRAVLVDQPSDTGQRVTALRSGFDEALDTRMADDELASRVDLLVEDVRKLLAARHIELGEQVSLDRERRQLVVAGRPVHLRPREYALLDVLSQEPGRTFTREELLKAVGAADGHADLRSVDVHVTWLREKLEPAGDHGPLLVTVRGVGYRLEVGAREAGVNESLTRRQSAVDAPGPA